MAVFNDVYQAFGFFGGLLFPLATGFQTVKVFRTQSAEDISYGWQSTYILAHGLYLVYSIHFGLWVIYSTQIAELVLLILMIIGKVYFELHPKQKVDKDGQGNESPCREAAE